LISEDSLNNITEMWFFTWISILWNCHIVYTQPFSFSESDSSSSEEEDFDHSEHFFQLAKQQVHFSFLIFRNDVFLIFFDFFSMKKFWKKIPIIWKLKFD
jgi:hypothetical protein